MNSRSFATLTLDFDLDADPVAGVVRTGADRGEPFAGWLALTRAIERTLDDARAAAVSSARRVDGRTSTSDPSRSQP